MAANSEPWRVIFNPQGDAGDIIAYGAGLAEGRIIGKYQLSNESLTNTIVIQGVRRKTIVAGADISIEKDKADAADIDVGIAPRQSRKGARPLGSVFLSEIMATAAPRFKAVEVDAETPAVLLYTSGTTGTPKGVQLSHQNFLSQYRDIVAKILPLRLNDYVVGVLPLYHVYGLSNGLIATFFFGSMISLIPQYSPNVLLENIVAIKATVLIAIPSMYTHLLTLARARKTEMPKSLRICVSGGAPLPHTTLNDFETVFQTRITEGYGLTETTSSVCLNKSGENFKPGSIGPSAPGVEMRVVDESDQEVPRGETGEIVIKGKTVTVGYWNNPAATAETLQDGWLHTGDLGYQDSDGFFFITDRKKDLIIRGGYNISPREVEEVIFTHPGVADVAVIGQPDKRGDEAVKAFVVRKDGATVAEKEIVEFCAVNLAPYKVPKFVEFREQLPKSATGKILRKELRDDYQDVRLMERGAMDGAAPADAAATTGTTTSAGGREE